jgi:hypothetical protein
MIKMMSLTTMTTKPMASQKVHADVAELHADLDRLLGNSDGCQGSAAQRELIQQLRDRIEVQQRELASLKSRCDAVRPVPRAR